MKVGISLPVRELKDDLKALKDFAQAAEELGLNHLRVPDQVIRPGNGHLHEPMMLLAYIAAVTKNIELVPSVIISPTRQTALLAKQAASLDIMAGGRVRIGIGVGTSEEEYHALGHDFHTRGQRVEEQMLLLKKLWTEEQVDFRGTFESIPNVGINPLPIQRPIPLWIGASGVPKASIRSRIGKLADGWFVLASPEEYPEIRDDINQSAEESGRSSKDIGAEAGVAVVGPRESEWQDRVKGWQDAGLTHLCLRTLGGGLEQNQHIPTMQQAAGQLDVKGN